jgi:hypothetical protein
MDALVESSAGEEEDIMEEAEENEEDDNNESAAHDIEGHPEIDDANARETKLFITPTVRVELVHAESPTIVFVHEAVIEAIPYFSAQRARWTSGDGLLRLQLPEGATDNHFLLLTKCLYTPERTVRFKHVAERHHVTKLAALLLSPNLLHLLHFVNLLKKGLTFRTLSSAAR